MRKILLPLLCLLCAAASAQTWQQTIVSALNRFTTELDTAHYSTGIQVYDLTDNRVLWNYHDQKVMRPASCQKLLTTISALDVLGADYILTTTASCTGNIITITYPDHESRYLEGDIYVRGGFDPTYTFDDLLQIVSAVKGMGIDSIAGFIYADTSFKDLTLLGNGWCWDDEPSIFHPFISPLIFDRGKLTPEFNRYPSDILHNPAKHFAGTLASQLSLQGISCRGYSINAKTPDDAKPIYSKSTYLTELLPRILKNSDNLYAEALFYQLAHHSAGDNATYKDGVKVITGVLRSAGANLTKCKIHDGCGLSPYDFLSPATLVSMLRYAYGKKDIYDKLLPALPISGKDGTLERRMTRIPAKQKVFAKTGTVTGVSSLSGYVTASNGHILAFAIINNGLLKASIGHSIQDRICAELSR